MNPTMCAYVRACVNVAVSYLLLFYRLPAAYKKIGLGVLTRLIYHIVVTS